MPNRMQALGITHVVVLMLENRGFDHVLGWLYGPEEHPHVVTREDDTRPFLGLSTVPDLSTLANPSPLPGQAPIPPHRGATSPAIPEFNPGEHFTHIMAQMWGVPRSSVNWGDPTSRAGTISYVYSQKNAVPMNGYVVDFAETIAHEAYAKPTPELVHQIMETYLPGQLPVLNGLAKHYAVSDEWFCSVPSQTNTNRAFSTAGTSRGLVTNNYFDAAYQSGYERLLPLTEFLVSRGFATGSNADRLPITTRSIFSLLSEFDVDWKLFWQSTWPPEGVASGYQTVQYVRCMFPELDNDAYNDHFVRIDPTDSRNALFSAARAGTLPPVTWVEPRWGGGPAFKTGSAEGPINQAKQKAAVALRLVGTDMHPSCDTTVAEDFVHELYEALTESPSWASTLFVLTFDENGGTYDHVSPPGSVPREHPEDPPPDTWPVRPSGSDRTPPPGPTGKKSPMAPKTRTEFGFLFDQLGIRVPTLLISPLIQKNTLFRSPNGTPFDHTSLLATILDWQGIPRDSWGLGARTRVAPNFDAAFLDPATQPVPRTDSDYSASVASLGSGRPLISGAAYRARFVGNPWGKPGVSLYLGTPEWSAIFRGYYPTTTADVEKAQPIYLELSSNANLSVPVLNMATLKIHTTQPGQVVSSSAHGLQIGQLDSFGVSDKDSYVFCVAAGSKYSDVWQVRLMDSRSRQAEVLTDTPVTFMSTRYQSLSSAFDPYQRLVPHPEKSKYLTTRAGVWGAWVLEEVDG